MLASFFFNLRIGINSSLNVWKNLPLKPPGSGFLLMTDFVLLIQSPLLFVSSDSMILDRLNVSGYL
jgi:hypothetical protein